MRFIIHVFRLASRIGGAREFKPAALTTILVVELTRLGDLLVALPAVRLLRKQFPRAPLSIVVDDRFAPFVRVIEPEIRVIGVRNPGSLRGLWRALVAVRRAAPALALNLSPAGRNALVVLASGARGKVGYLTPLSSVVPYLHSTPVESFGIRITQGIVFGRENLTFRPGKVLEALGISRDGPGTISLPDGLEESSESTSQGPGLAPRERRACVHPFSGWEYRTWSIAKFAELATLLMTRLQLTVAFVCAVEEAGKLEGLRRHFANDPRVRFLASGNLVETATAIRHSALFIGNDSGPLHLAAMLGVPAIGLFGPAPPELTGPRSERVALLYKQVDCSPCDQKTCLRPEHPCLELIGPEEVFERAERLLRTYSSAPEAMNG